jgi:hypothetical protein
MQGTRKRDPSNPAGNDAGLAGKANEAMPMVLGETAEETWIVSAADDPVDNGRVLVDGALAKIALNVFARNASS